MASPSPPPAVENPPPSKMRVFFVEFPNSPLLCSFLCFPGFEFRGPKLCLTGLDRSTCACGSSNFIFFSNMGSLSLLCPLVLLLHPFALNFYGVSRARDSLRASPTPSFIPRVVYLPFFPLVETLPFLTNFKVFLPFPWQSAIYCVPLPFSLFQLDSLGLYFSFCKHVIPIGGNVLEYAL